LKLQLITYYLKKEKKQEGMCFIIPEFQRLTKKLKEVIIIEKKKRVTAVWIIF